MVQNDHSQLKRLAAKVTPEEMLLSGKSKAKDSFLRCASLTVCLSFSLGRYLVL